MKKLFIFSLTLFILLVCSLYSDAVVYASCRKQSVAIKFQKQQGYKYGRKGYIIDHVCALACGGLDITSNMQYQTYKESLEKDKWERTPQGCLSTCNDKNAFSERTVFNCKRKP